LHVAALQLRGRASDVAQQLRRGSMRASAHAGCALSLLWRPQVSAFTEREASRLRAALHGLLADAPALARARPGELKAEARRVGDEVLELERFIQLNQVDGWAAGWAAAWCLAGGLGWDRRASLSPVRAPTHTHPHTHPHSRP
jgi:hypothetical protein